MHLFATPLDDISAKKQKIKKMVSKALFKGGGEVSRKNDFKMIKKNQD